MVPLQQPASHRVRVSVQILVGGCSETATCGEHANLLLCGASWDKQTPVLTITQLVNNYGKWAINGNRKNHRRELSNSSLAPDVGPPVQIQHDFSRHLTSVLFPLTAPFYCCFPVHSLLESQQLRLCETTETKCVFFYDITVHTNISHSFIYHPLTYGKLPGS